VSHLRHIQLSVAYEPDIRSLESSVTLAEQDYLTNTRLELIPMALVIRRGNCAPRELFRYGYVLTTQQLEPGISSPTSARAFAVWRTTTSRLHDTAPRRSPLFLHVMLP
jgi:hypothetical protein